MSNNIKTIIAEWIETSYGRAEAENPSWDINALATEISKKIEA